VNADDVRLRAHRVTHTYATSPVLDGVDLTAHRGRVLGLVGPNGSGKTTLLRVLHDSLSPDQGSATVDGVPLTRMSDRARARRLAVVAQEPGAQPGWRVVDRVLLGRSPHRHALQAYSPDDHRVATRALRFVGMLDHAARHLDELSGGERQRVLIAQAVAQEADILLLDEPTNHLDVRYQHDVLGLVAALGCTAVVVLHDLNLAAHYCDDVVLLDRGRVVASGTAEEVLTPERLEPVYGVDVHVVHHRARRHLLLTPRADPAGAVPPR
jgi:iron complex transport system ATP-binding protein